MRRRRQRRWRIRNNLRRDTKIHARSRDAALASWCRNEAMRAGAGRELRCDQLPGISTVGFSGRGARERHRWLELRRRCPFLSQRYLLELRLVPLRLKVPLRRMRGACCQSTSAVTAQTAALLSRQLGSRVAKPPFCHSVLSPAARHLRIALHFLGFGNKQKGNLAFPPLISSVSTLIGSPSFSLLPAHHFHYRVHLILCIRHLLSPLVPGPSPLGRNHGLGHRYGRWCRRRGFPGNP